MRRRWLGIGGIVLLLASAFLVGLLSTRADQAPRASPPGTPRSAPDSVDVADEVRYELETAYYRQVGDEVLARRSVDGMLGR